MQYACSILSSTAFWAPKYFSTPSHKRNKFLRFFFISTTLVWIFSHSKPYQMHIFVHENYLISRSDFKENWIFSTDFQKVLRCQVARKSVKWGPNYSMLKRGRTDGRTNSRNDKSKLIITLHSFANTHKLNYNILEEKRKWVLY